MQCWQCRGWGHTTKRCPSPLNCQKGGNPEGAPPHKQQTSQCGGPPTDTAKTAHSFAIRLSECYLNPDPLVRLIGKANESEILIDDTMCLGLINSGAQFSTIAMTCTQQLGLVIHHLNKILKIEAMRGYIPYIGYVEVNVKFQKKGIQ